MSLFFKALEGDVERLDSEKERCWASYSYAYYREAISRRARTSSPQGIVDT
jgi:hypothetical protein